MAKQTVSKRTKQTLAGFVVATALAIGGYYFNQPTVKEATDQVVSVVTSSQQETPSKELASSVLTKSARSQLGNDIEWNGAGALSLRAIEQIWMPVWLVNPMRITRQKKSMERLCLRLPMPS